MSYKRSVFQAGPVKNTAPAGVEVLQEKVNHKTIQEKGQTQKAKQADKTMDIYLSDNCEFEMQDELISRVFSDLTLENPKYQQALKHGRYGTTKHPQYIILFKQSEKNGNFIVPRGYINSLLDLCRQHQIKPNIIDQRRTLKDIDFTFKGELRDYQERAVQDILSDTQGVLIAPPGSGKTVMAQAVMAERRQPTLILVHSVALLNQWKKSISDFLKMEAGLMGGGKKEVKPITVGIFQTVVKHLETLPKQFGHLIVDECHKVPAQTFMRCARTFDCKYLLGLSATPYRSDGLESLIYLTLGDSIHEVESRSLQESESILKPEIILRETDFQHPDTKKHSVLLEAVTTCEDRNRLIAHDIFTQNDGVNLICSDRKEQLRTLFDLVQSDSKVILTGDIPLKERETIIEQLDEGKIKNVFSTIQLIGEGFDCSAFSNLFIASPFKSPGKAVQLIGRILRPQPGKSAKVFDYVDLKQGLLKWHAEQRQIVYNKHYT